MAYGDFRRKAHAWRSSNWFILLTLTFAVFVDIFLAYFVVPILPYILEVRFGIKGANVQTSMSIVMSFFGLTMFILSPIVGILIDKFSTRKWPLVIGLISQIIATCLTAASTNLVWLYFSRIFQGAAASILWIASLATIADTVGSSAMGKTMGVIGPIITTGAFFGPMVGGLLLSSAGYWHTWLAPIAMISLDLGLRLAMIDRPKPSTMAHRADTKTSNEAEVNTESGTQGPDKDSRPSLPATSDAAITQSKSSNPTISSATSLMPNIAPAPSSAASEATPLLTIQHHSSSPTPTKPHSNAGSFLIILQQRRVISSIVLDIILSTAFNSFHATLVLRIEELYHWGPREVGFLYLALVGPSVLLGPFAGWLRDAIGVWWPNIVGTGFATPLYVVIGLVGDERFPWTQGELGKGIFIGALVLMGFAIELTSGTCLVEGTLVIDELEAHNPGIFGTQGGYSRLFSITSMLSPLASFIGPLLSGALTVRYNYAVMNDVMAALTFICFIITVLFIGPRKARAVS